MRSVKSRLAGMMALEYMVVGAWAVVLPAFLMAGAFEGGLNLTGTQVGLLYGTFAIGATISPVISGFLADRLINAERLLAILHGIGTLCLVVTYIVCHQAREQLQVLGDELGVQAATVSPALTAITDSTFVRLFVALLCNSLAFQPTFAVTNTIALRNLPNPDRQFAGTRAWGTASYMLTGITVGVAFPAKTAEVLLLAAAFEAVAAVFCICLPATPPLGTEAGIHHALGLSAIGMMRHPSFRAYVNAALIMSVMLCFHNVYTNRYLVELGVPHAAAFQSTAQMSELLCLVMMPKLRHSLGTKNLLVIGVAASVVRYLCYSSGQPWLIIGLGLPMHGVSFALFFISAANIVDAIAPSDLRASAQGFITLTTTGIGAFFGTWLAGRIVDAMRTDGLHDWMRIWLIPAAGSAIAALYLMLHYREPVELRV